MGKKRPANVFEIRTWMLDAFDLFTRAGKRSKNTIPFISIKLITWYVELDTFHLGFVTGPESVSVLQVLLLSSIIFIHHHLISSSITIITPTATGWKLQW